MGINSQNMLKICPFVCLIGNRAFRFSVTQLCSWNAILSGCRPHQLLTRGHRHSHRRNEGRRGQVKVLRGSPPAAWHRWHPHCHCHPHRRSEAHAAQSGCGRCRVGRRTRRDRQRGNGSGPAACPPTAGRAPGVIPYLRPQRYEK